MPGSSSDKNDLGLLVQRVARVLERHSSLEGFPSKLRVDNGPELISTTLADWTEEQNEELEFIQSGEPTQNFYFERFNRTYRDEILNMYAFKTLTEVRHITEKWIDEYNEERPHDSLGNLTPNEYRAAQQERGNSNFGRH